MLVKVLKCRVRVVIIVLVSVGAVMPVLVLLGGVLL